MQEQFVTSEISDMLSDIGYNKPFSAGDASYYYRHVSESDRILFYCSDDYMRIFPEQKFVIAPLWQQVISWFATKHNIYIYVLRTMKTTEGFEFLYIVEKWGDDDMVCDYTDYFKTYEEAREAAILEAIKIVKGN